MGVGAGGAAAIAAGVGAVGSIGGSLITSSAAGKAGAAQADAANRAAALGQQQYDQVREDLLPYAKMGEAALPDLQAFPAQASNVLQGARNTAQANIPGANGNLSNIDWLRQQPGYAFQLAEGQKAVQNSATGRGLGISGSAMKAGATFATGLADSNFQTAFNQSQTKYADYSQQYQNALSNLNAQYSYLSGNATLGENAAARSGAIGQAGSAAAGKNIADAGVATAAGINRAASAESSGLNSLGSAGLNYLAYKNLASNGTGAFDSASQGYSNPIQYMSANPTSLNSTANSGMGPIY
jgi:hypothetical protein